MQWWSVTARFRWGECDDLEGIDPQPPTTFDTGAGFLPEVDELVESEVLVEAETESQARELLREAGCFEVLE